MLSDEWAALSVAERRRIRRLVRIGRPPDDPDQARLAEALAVHQRAQPWWRWFWLWFVPGLVLALAVASLIHPVVVGIVLASGGQALLVRRNNRRMAPLAGGGPSAA